MNKGQISTRVVILIVVAVILIAAGVWFWYASQSQGGQVYQSQTQNQTSTLLAQAQYYCNNNKTIDAKFYQGTSTQTVEPGQPPVPSGSVDLVLSDGRKMTLAQTISGSGTRYANSDESIVFVSEGNGAALSEGTQQTYSGCISVVANPGNLPNVYENRTEGFSVRYPEGYTVNSDYRYQEMGPGMDINGVSFMIPESVATGTNLGPDTYISVEEIPQTATATCSADLFLPQGAPLNSAPKTINDNGVTYSFASTTGAGAGNRYEEWIYAIPGTSPCVAVRYWIHYGVFENYPPGTVQQFNQQQLLSQFDSVRHTLTLQQLGI